MNKPNIVGPEYIAELLGIEVSTVKMDARRSPTSLPPRLAIPGRKALMWIEEDVIDWLNSFRPQAKRKVDGLAKFPGNRRWRRVVVALERLERPMPGDSAQLQHVRQLGG